MSMTATLAKQSLEDLNAANSDEDLSAKRPDNEAIDQAEQQRQSVKKDLEERQEELAELHERYEKISDDGGFFEKAAGGAEGLDEAADEMARLQDEVGTLADELAKAREDAEDDLDALQSVMGQSQDQDDEETGGEASGDQGSVVYYFADTETDAFIF